MEARLYIENLKVTQNELRNIEQIPEMIQYVSNDGYFTKNVLQDHSKQKAVKCDSLIEIARFEDGELYIHNGHHRAISVYMGGRTYLRQDEYYILNWFYNDYDVIEYLRTDGSWMGWVTPFDVRNEVRVADIKAFKDNVKKIYDECGEERATVFIQNNKDQYCVPKTYFTLKELVDSYLEMVPS